MIKFLKTAIATAAVVSAGLASAQTFDFTTLKPTPASGSTSFCGFNSGSDICGTSMTFVQGLLTATATATYLNASSYNQLIPAQGTKPASSVSVPVKVVQDYNGGTPKYVGLGVYHTINDTSDDNVTVGELLTLTFNQVVTLTGLNFRAEGHGLYSDLDDTFLLNNVEKNLAPTISGLSLTGTTFTFGYGGRDADQYYLSGMTVTAVPEPETLAMMLAGLGLVGTIARRRKIQQA